MKPVLQIEKIVARYGRKQVLSEVSFELQAGSTCALLGANGVGKSTLLRMILGLEKIRSGSIHVDGQRVGRKHGSILQRVGYVPDTSDVCPWMTLDEYFRFLRAQYPTWNNDRAAELADMFGLLRKQPFKSLSRGQSTKAMLAGALAFQPALLLLDEPFGSLDPGARDSVLRGVLDGITDAGCGVLVATHDMHMAARIADSVVMLREGTVQARGPLDEVLASDSESNQVPQRLKALFDGADQPRRLSA